MILQQGNKALLKQRKKIMKYLNQSQSVSELRKFAKSKNLVLRKANCFIGGAVAYALYNKENNQKESILFALSDVKKIANHDGDFSEHLLLK